MFQEHYQETIESVQAVIERYQERTRVVAASGEFIKRQASEEFPSSERPAAAKKVLTATSGLDRCRNSWLSRRQFFQCRCLPTQYGGRTASVPHLRICSRIKRIPAPLKSIWKVFKFTIKEFKKRIWVKVCFGWQKSRMQWCLFPNILLLFKINVYVLIYIFWNSIITKEKKLLLKIK